MGRWELEIEIIKYIVVVVVLVWCLRTIKPYKNWWLYGIPIDSSFPSQQFQIPQQRVDEMKRKE